MKKNLIIILILLIFSGTGFTQKSERTSAEFYAGMGVSMVFFTQSDVWNNYPVLDVNNTSFMYEISAFAGIKINKFVALEFNPAFVINKSNDKDGFYFTQNNLTRYYRPQNVSLVMIPLNLRAKFFPIAGEGTVGDIKSGFYTGFGAGITFIGESYDSYIYEDKNSVYYSGIDNSKKNSWRPDVQIFAGLDLQNKFGLGLEVGYRIIPGGMDYDKPVISAFVPNMNYVYLNIKGGLGF